MAETLQYKPEKTIIEEFISFITHLRTLVIINQIGQVQWHRDFSLRFR